MVADEDAAEISELSLGQLDDIVKEMEENHMLSEDDKASPVVFKNIKSRFEQDGGKTTAESKNEMLLSNS